MPINILDPISTIMTTDLITVHPKESLQDVKEIFEKHNIHHLPVVEYKKIVGIISKSDLFHYERAYTKGPYREVTETVRLRSYPVGEVMIKGMATLEPDDRINVALEIFKENLFHSIPIVKDGELVGLLTTHDVIKALSS